MAAVFEIYKDKTGDYRWNLRHENTHIIAVSDQWYSKKALATEGIETFRENVSSAPIDDVTGEARQVHA